VDSDGDDVERVDESRLESTVLGEIEICGEDDDVVGGNLVVSWCMLGA
jgi:hypothetical protein